MWDYIYAFLCVQTCVSVLAFFLWVPLGGVRKLAALFGATVGVGSACLWLAFGPLSTVWTLLLVVLCLIVTISVAKFVDEYCTYDN